MTGAEQYAGGTLYGLHTYLDPDGDTLDVYRHDGLPGVKIAMRGQDLDETHAEVWVQLGPDDSNELAIALAGETGPAPELVAPGPAEVAMWGVDLPGAGTVAVLHDGEVRYDGLTVPDGAEALREAALVLLAAAARSEQARRG